VANRWRAWFEKLLPWYQPHIERLRNARTEAISKRSVAGRARAERIIDEYRDAAETADTAAEAVIDEARKD
jgi:hypothetical protein